MIKIAYLIEAHTDAEQLVRLCSALQLSGDIFIHVDKKTKSMDFWNIINDYVKNNHCVKILAKRHFVAWGGVFASGMLQEFISGGFNKKKKI